MSFENKKVLVYGLGISGLGAARALIKQKAKITLYDAKKIDLNEQDQQSFSENNVQIAPQNIPNDYYNNFDFIILSPGISIDTPFMQESIKNNVQVIGEVELASRVSGAKFIAITGTNGKTTTTTIVSEMVKKLHVNSGTGGNIGKSLSLVASEVDKKEDIIVAEISSYQLESIKHFRPYVAAILNITPDHLDRHGNVQNYAKVKARIFENQLESDYLILNAADDMLQGMAKTAKSQVCFFSSTKKLQEGAFLENDNITISWKGDKQVVCPVSSMNIFGQHNVENALAACACAYFAGVSIADMKQTLEHFEGVEHRNEYIKTINGVKYYNDSKATNPESAIKALDSFAGNIILIAGGYDKMTDLTEFMQKVKQKTDYLILLGSSKERFNNEAIKNDVQNIILVDTFEQAVDKAYSLAKAPQVVLFSPASASFDMFNNFEQRGKYFKQLIEKL